jgi:predicted porin
LSLSHEADIAQFRLTGFRTTANQLTVLTATPTITSTGATLIVSRNLNPSLTGSVNAGFTREELLGGASSSYSTQFNLTYSFSTATQAYLLGAYIHRLSSTSLVAATSPLSGSVSDASITIGIRRVF